MLHPSSSAPPRPAIDFARAVLAYAENGVVPLPSLKPEGWTLAEIRAVAGACRVAIMRSRGRVSIAVDTVWIPQADATNAAIVAAGARAQRRESRRVLAQLAAAGPALEVEAAAEGLGALLAAHLSELDGNVDSLLDIALARSPRAGLELCADVAADVERYDTAGRPELQHLLQAYRTIVTEAAHGASEAQASPALRGVVSIDACSMD